MNRAAIIGNLLRRASLTPPDLLAADVANALHDAGGNHLVLYVVDYEQETLQPVALASDLLDERPKGVNIEGTMAGRSFQSQHVLSSETDDGWRVWAPVRERAERIGVLELGFPNVEADIDRDELLALADDLGLLVGHLTHTAGRYTDLIELRRRRRPMNLAAEMQWDLLPPLSFSSPELAIAGLLEPAYFVAGDAFDYSLNGEMLGFAIIDAMGHGVHSTLASTLALGAFRYGRRRGLELTVIAEHIDDAVAEHFHGDCFVTGHLASLDVGTGELRWVNAGHPPPLLMRGAKVVAELACEPCLPLRAGDRHRRDRLLPAAAGRPGPVLFRRGHRGPALVRGPVRPRTAGRSRWSSTSAPACCPRRRCDGWPPASGSTGVGSWRTTPPWCSWSGSPAAEAGYPPVSTGAGKGKRSGPKGLRSSCADRGGQVWLVAAGSLDGVTNAGELRGGLLAQLGQGHDADHGDEGEKQGVLDECRSTLAATAEHGPQVGRTALLPVSDQVHGLPSWVSAPSGAGTRLVSHVSARRGPT